MTGDHLAINTPPDTIFYNGKIITATPQQYNALMLELNRLGSRHAPHIATNEALEAVLEAHAAADRESPIRDKRWVVEHIPNVAPPLIG